MLRYLFSASTWAATLRLSAPLGLAAMGRCCDVRDFRHLCFTSESRSHRSRNCNEFKLLGTDLVAFVEYIPYQRIDYGSANQEFFHDTYSVFG